MLLVFLAICFLFITIAYLFASKPRRLGPAATWPPFLCRTFVTLSAMPKAINATSAMRRPRRDHHPGCTTSWPQTMASPVLHRNGAVRRGITTGPVLFRTPRTRKSSRVCFCLVSPMARASSSWVKPKRVGQAIESPPNMPRATHHA